MPTININNNTVVVKTAAQWAADTTVYTNKQILVTSDAFWGSTDQRKFKIADGVQTWSNLDYPPFETGADTLSEVLAAGSTTGGQAITGDSTELFLIVNDAIALLGYDAGSGVTANVSASSTHAQIDFAGATYSGFVEVQDTKTEVQHDNLIELDSPSVRLVQETASRVAIIDASKDIVGADTATYPNLTELSYVKGVTSAIQTQLNAKQAAGSYLVTTNNLSDLSNIQTAKENLQVPTFSIKCGWPPLSVADSVTYRASPLTALTASTSSALNRQFKVPNDCTCVFAMITWTGTAGSNEAVTLRVANITAGTTYDFSTTLDWSINLNSLTFTGGTLQGTADDIFECQIVVPAFASNPSSWQVAIELGFNLR